MKNNFLKAFFVLVLIAGILFPLYLRKRILTPHFPPVEKNSFGTIGKGGFLLTSLQKYGFSGKEIFLIEEALKPIFDFRKCRPDDRYEITSVSGKFKSLRYWTSPLNFYLVEVEGEAGLIAALKTVKTDEVIVGVKGKIESSLYESMLKKGLSPEVVMNFADIFAWQIDFLTEPREGDVFKLIWKQYQKDGKSLLDGRILAAQYENSGKKDTALYFEGVAGKGSYYSPEGKSLKKMFLRSPLNYRRISSYFSYHRLHPILKYYRPHLGIDYAAPIGTPVSSVARGVVVKKGWSHDGGRYLKIKHSNGYSTFYAHLSRYARGMRRGKKVEQGQVVAYVGSSGLSTGPHLYFRIKKNGKAFNFLRIKIPPSKSLNPKYKTSFAKIKEDYLLRLNEIVGGASQTTAPGICGQKIR